MKNKKNAIKQQRIQSYFIEAAKTVIKQEGVRNVSVRKIADLSGYSYGSIYNYYDDLDDLLFEVKNSMIYDLMGQMGGQPEEPLQSVEDIKNINCAFADYFIDNPNIYEFFYSYPLQKTGTTPMDEMGFNESRLLPYEAFVEKGIIKKEDLPTVFNTILYSLFGLLNLYFSSNGMTKQKLHEDLSDIIDYILKAR